jgi:hypothetical protein
MKNVLWGFAATLFLGGCIHDRGNGNDMNGEAADMELATALWEKMADENYETPSDAWAEFPGKDGLYPPDSTLVGNDPHMGPDLFRTFVTTLADMALRDDDFPLPNRSVLVKENYMVSEGDTVLDAVTVMEKRAGYNPDDGDWFWVKYEPDGTVEGAGRMQMCIQCHNPAAARDYVWTRVVE